MIMNEILIGFTWPEIAAGAVAAMAIGLAFALTLICGGKAGE